MASQNLDLHIQHSQDILRHEVHYKQEPLPSTQGFFPSLPIAHLVQVQSFRLMQSFEDVFPLLHGHKHHHTVGVQRLGIVIVLAGSHLFQVTQHACPAQIQAAVSSEDFLFSRFAEKFPKPLAIRGHLCAQTAVVGESLEGYRSERMVWA